MRGRPAPAVTSLRAVTRTAVVVAAVVVAAAAGPVGAAGTGAAAPSRPQLSSYVLTSALPGYETLYQGPLTAARFASYAPDPARAAAAFAGLEADPTFQSVLHAWKGPSGGGIVDVVLAFPTAPAGVAYLNGQQRVLGAVPGVRRQAVPGIPGAVRYAYLTASPISAVQQVVILSAGRSVATVNFTSPVAASGAPAVTTAQADATAQAQYRLLSHSPFDPPPAAPGGRGPMGWVLLGVGVALLAAVAVLVLRWRRAAMPAVRQTSGPGPAADPVLAGLLPGEPVATGPTGGSPARTGTPPPGWYLDPGGRGGLRYWDGSAWTDSRARHERRVMP